MKFINSLKTIATILLLFVLLFTFSSCSQDDDFSKKPDIPIDINGSINVILEDYEFVVNSDNTLTITKYKGKGISIEIPEEIYGKKVTAIGTISQEIGAFQDCTTLFSVVIPEGVTAILDNSFRGCSSLNAVTIPASVTVIWHCAFEDSPNLQSIYFEGDPPQTGNYLFDYSSPLTIYYHEDAAGWTNPWYGCPTAIY